MDFSPPFTHVVLDVKDKRLLAKVSVNNLAWSLKAHGGVQVGLKDETDQTRSFILNQLQHRVTHFKTAFLNKNGLKLIITGSISMKDDL